ncbi:unnamed protein product [Symbiodinium necroappetens]|uniref:Uncharacterized protein n=1 Tax=Symbiodinium necroappetens TaxID=1628268 RepID=A0A812VPU9_9DINO|nr:unnamed protein product [Symbiodinium necroappetens]
MLRPYAFYAGSFCRHIDVFFKQITACLPKSQAIKDAETTKKKAEADKKEAIAKADAARQAAEEQAARDAFKAKQAAEDAKAEQVRALQDAADAKKAAEKAIRAAQKKVNEQTAAAEAAKQAKEKAEEELAKLEEKKKEWQQDLSYLIRVLEEGAVQLHEPMPAAVSVQQLQWGTRCLQRAIMLLTAALDSSLRGECCWNTPKLWGELRDLITPAAVLLEQRGDSEEQQQRGTSSGSAEGPRRVHPADVLQLAQGHEEGGPRTRTSSTAAQLLFEAAGEFRKLMPTLVDEQVPLAVQLLHAVEATQQALFGGVMAATEETQTEAGGDNDYIPIADGPCKEAGATTGANLEPGGACAPALASDHQCEDGETAATGVAPSHGGAPHSGQWTALGGITSSQAQALMTDSLEDAIQQAAQTQLDQSEEDGGQANSLATTPPWHAWSQPLMGEAANLHVGGSQDTGSREQAPSEPSSEPSCQDSHRRRRMHAGGH